VNPSLEYLDIVRQAARKSSPYDKDPVMYWDLEDPDWKELRGSCCTQWNYFRLYLHMHLIMSGWDFTHNEVTKLKFTDLYFLNEDESYYPHPPAYRERRDENFSQNCASNMDHLTNEEKEKLTEDLQLWEKVILEVLRQNGGKIDVLGF
jgi:hypothetical protein